MKIADLVLPVDDAVSVLQSIMKSPLSGYTPVYLIANIPANTALFNILPSVANRRYAVTIQVIETVAIVGAPLINVYDIFTALASGLVVPNTLLKNILAERIEYDPNGAGAGNLTYVVSGWALDFNIL